MNLKQKMFCEYYCGICKGNAAAAAIKAGYKENYAKKHAYKLLNNPEIKAYIREITSQKTAENIATIEDIHAFWTEIMNNEEARIADRLRAAELLAKCKGAFKSDDW